MRQFKDISIQKKICYLFSSYMLIFLICIIFILHGIYRQQIYHDLTQRSHYEDELIIHQMERLYQNVESCCNNVIINLNLAINSSDISKPEKHNRDIQEKILGVMDNNFILFPDICEISILYDNGMLYQKEKSRNFIFSGNQQELVQRFIDLKISTKGQWYYPCNDNSSVYFVKTFHDINANKKIGYVFLKLNEKIIFRNYQNKNKNSAEIYIFDENDMLLSSTERELVKEIYSKKNLDERYSESKLLDVEISKRKDDKKNYIKEYKTKMGWKIFSILDVQSGMQNLRKITIYIIFASFTLMILFIITMLFLMKKVLNPIVILAEHMRVTGENLIQKIEVESNNDEVGILIDSFNQMVEMNDKLVQKVALNEREKRQLELSLLQMQIKPHFLYNTLDTAFCLNSMHMYREANYMIKQLAGYYRLVLNHGEEWISFAEEVQAIEKYLDIQSVRYRELVSYKISIDEELYEFRIPKMTLQPLVENAIYHGIKPSGRKGHILILGELFEDEVTISVTDDGVGMSQQLFENILCEKRKCANQESFGLKSVAERMRLFYGNNTKVELSEMPIGTSIVLTISLRKDEDIEISGTIS